MPSVLRIAYLANFSPIKLGTGEGKVMLLAAEAQQRGHDFTLFCRAPLHETVERRLVASGAKIEHLDDIAAAPVRSALRLRRQFDVAVLNLIAPRSKIALATYAAWPLKVLFVDHVSGPAQGAADDTPQSGLRRLLDRLTMCRVAEAAGVSQYVERRLRQRFQLSAGRTRTIYGGVDTERFNPPESSPPRSCVTITVVAALIPEKGVDVLIKALGRGVGSNWRLQIVGIGPDEQRLRELVSALGIEAKVRFLGLRDDVDDILRETDIMVHPATWDEALGYTVLEGMASACAVVASDVGAIPELIQDGRNGVLVPPNSVEALQSALQRLAANSGLQRDLGLAARASVMKRFDMRQNVLSTLEWIESAGS